MAEKKILTVSNEALRIQKSIEEICNDSDGENSLVVYDSIIDKERERVQKLAEDLGVRAYNGITTLQKRFDKINKPDQEFAVRPNDDALEFTQEKRYSVQRANELTAVAEYHKELVTAFDTAMSKGTEKNWQAVGTLLAKIKKALGDVFEK